MVESIYKKAQTYLYCACKFDSALKDTLRVALKGLDCTHDSGIEGEIHSSVAGVTYSPLPVHTCVFFFVVIVVVVVVVVVCVCV